jgi:glycosyltransferase involved in cell wall biosynthesis
VSRDAAGFGTLLIFLMAGYGPLRPALRRLVAREAWQKLVQFARAFVEPRGLPQRLERLDAGGFLRGLMRWGAGRSVAARTATGRSLIESLGDAPEWRARDDGPAPIALRTVDLMERLEALTNLGGHPSTRIYVRLGRRLLGRIDHHNGGHDISSGWLRVAIAGRFALPLLRDFEPGGESALRQDFRAALGRLLGTDGAAARLRLVATHPLSVLVPTLNRPQSLRRCLQALTVQDIPNSYEIIVVDRNPDSGLSVSVVAEFPAVRLIQEPSGSEAAARNAGLRAATGDVIAMTGDAAVPPPHWLRQIAAPFAREDVDLVTGSVIPARLDTVSQARFDRTYGSAAEAPYCVRVADWLHRGGLRPVPDWRFGSGDNAAVRRAALQQSRIEAFDESLGAGTPVGAGDDVYLFYRIVKAGCIHIHDPEVCVVREPVASRGDAWRRVFDRGKARVGVLLVAIRNDGDLRGIGRMLMAPVTFVHRLLEPDGAARGWILIDAAGAVVGPWSWLWSLARRAMRRDTETEARAGAVTGR